MTEDQLRSDPAEAALLGALAFHGNAMHHVLRAVAADDFYKPARGAIWLAAQQLATNGKPIDPVAVTRELQGGGQLNRVIEQLIVAEMTTSVSVDIAGRYAQTVVDLAKRRDMLRACQRATDIVMSHPGEASEALSAARAEFEKLSINEDEPATLSWRQMIDEFETVHAPGGSRPGIPSPWWQLDMLIGGLFGSRMYTFGGRPGDGKSTAVLNCAFHAAKESGKQVLIFSKEMPSIDVTGRFISAAAEIPLDEIAARRLSDDMRQRARDWAKKIGNLPIRVNAGPGGLTAIKNQARAQANRTGLDMLIVDYLQLVKTEAPGRNREQEVAQVSRELKALCMELDCALLVPAQLNRGSVTRSDPKPTMADLRDSGQIEQDSDAVILLYRPVAENGEPKGGIRFIVDKNRHGSPGVVDLDWNGAYGLIR
jgi:replicative DNA helicase